VGAGPTDGVSCPEQGVAKTLLWWAARCCLSIDSCFPRAPQDAHRQRTINWCDSTGGTAAAFDFTTKGILQEALGRTELWRLVDAQGKPPGMLGMWPSRAISFIDNHDTGSTLNHWPFPSNHLQEGYAYIITHPGTPCIFVDHLWTEQGGLRKVRRGGRGGVLMGGGGHWSALRAEPGCYSSHGQWDVCSPARTPQHAPGGAALAASLAVPAAPTQQQCL
jgi:hypothetical protein